MSVVYGGMHSVVFIRLRDDSTKHSWTDLHLIPESRPIIALPEPKLQLIEIQGRSARIDLTDYTPGGLSYGPRSGELTFYVDHDRWNGWENAYNELSDFFNGDKFAVYLMDNADKIYEGRLYISAYNTGNEYSTLSIHYELESDLVTNTYVRATFKDSNDYGGTILQNSLIRQNTMPEYYSDPPIHPGYKFVDWDPSLRIIATDTVFTAVYRTVPTYTIRFVDWDGSAIKTTVVNEGDTPVPPLDPTRIGYRFVDWNSEIVPAIYDKTYTATYVKDDEYINDFWENVKTRINDGSYSSYYRVGDQIYLNMDNEYSGYAIVAGIDTDIDELNNAIPMTFITKDILTSSRPMNSSNTTSGGYQASTMKEYINSLKSILPSTLRDILIPAVKTSRDYNNGSPRDLSALMELWIPSAREIFGGTSYEQSGPIYGQLFNDTASRIKRINNSPSGWWLRSASSASNYRYIDGSGGSYEGSATFSSGVVLGFCVGHTLD